MDQRIIALYDEYTHKPLARRLFLRRLAALAGGPAAAAALLPFLENNYARAAIVADTDPRLDVEDMSYKGTPGQIHGYAAKPKGAGRLPAVVVIHENRGLNPYIKDVARRVALAGFVAIAPDLLSPFGGTPRDPEHAARALREMGPTMPSNNLVAAVRYAKERPDATGKVGCVGFCWGGGMANQLAIDAGTDLAAGVSFYGPTPAPTEVPYMKARMLLHYAGLDARINGGVPGYEKALKAAGVAYTLHMYEGVNHAFHNDTGGARYNQEAAELAWRRTIEFLKGALAE
ncbi:MAG: dienelactone hydrolase family protein [Pseudomonadota bacterium]